jgi:DNA phosphorothioation-associated putative methyltransferase
MDYGCGRGSDVHLLERQGFDCSGWDPVHAPHGRQRDADLVNLGYVVNVIEDPTERREALQRAWALAQRVLVVSARLRSETPDAAAVAPFADGLLTRIGTFQNYFDQHELRAWIDQTLETPSVAAAPGVYYVFRDPVERAALVAARYRRPTPVPRPRPHERLFAEHKELLDPLATFVAARGRLPGAGELAELTAIEDALGSVKRAFRVLEQASEQQAWDAVRAARTEDLLVYLALARFEGRPSFHNLPTDIQLDVKAFFGSYTAACKAADDALFSLGRQEGIDAACRSAPVGKAMPTAHVAAIGELPLLLRPYEGCARGYVGRVAGGNVIKLGRGEPKIAYLSYPAFEIDPHPALAESTPVHLQTFRVRQRSFAESRNPRILHRKEEFVGPGHPSRAKCARLTRLEEAKGLFSDPAMIGTREGWSRVLAEKGLSLRGHRLVNTGPAAT